MRTQFLRLALFAVVVCTLGGMVLSVSRLAKAQPAAATSASPGKPAEAVIEKLSFPENRDVNRQFEAVQEYLQQKNPKWREVTELAQKLLDNKSDYFYQFQEGDKRRVSVKDEISRMIGKLPKEGLEFYQLNYGPVADGLLKEAKENGYDKAKLAEVSQRYFHTKAGADATLLLAAVNLETGYFPEAAYGYQRLLARPDADKILDPKTLFKAAVAIRRAGDGKMTDAVAAVWALLEKNFPREGVQIGRKGYSLDMLKAELDKPVEMLFGQVGDQFVAMKGGNPTRAATAEAGAPFLGTIFNLPVLYRLEDDGQKEAADFVKAAVARTYRDSKQNRQSLPLIPGAFPVTAPNVIVFRGYDGVYAFYTRSFTDASGVRRQEGNLAWHQLGKYGAAAIRAGGSDDGESAQSDAANLKSWSEYWAGVNHGSVLFENPLAGSLSHDGKRVYFVDDFNVPPAMQQVNYDMGWAQPQGDTGPKGVGKKEYNRLVAVDLETGSLAWTLGRPAPGTRPDEVDKITSSALLAEGAYFLGPPVTVNGKLYALMERDGHLLLACLDPAKLSEAAPALKSGEKPRPGVRVGPQPQPELVWVQALGRANSPVRQDPLRRIQGAFLAAADGVMICPTNSGAVVAVDLNARSLLWAHTYATLDKGSEMGGGRFRGGPVRAVGQAANQWRSSTPVIAGGRVVVSAYDSGTVQCLDLRTGKLQWQESRKPDDLYVGGVAQDKVLIVGKSTVRAVKLVGDKDDKAQREKPTPAWKEELKVALPVGHGVVGKDGKFYLPVVGDPDKADDQTPAVWGVDTTTGKAVSKTLYRRKDVLPVGPAPDPRLALGNLVFHDGMMFSQSATEVVAFPLNEVKRREVQIALDKNPNDPAGLFSRGELSLEKGDLLKAVEDFKAAQANKPSEDVEHKIKQKLYVAYTELLRDKFDQGEPFLAEYKQLCEYKLDDTEPDFGRQREEQTRRRGLYYSLVAKGREAQGRLVEAFDHYRAYAELGEQGKLLPVPEDPNTAALPSVWASGRIDAMMRNAKDPAARKPLEDRVAKDWAEVKAANDLDRLRNFVKVFGAYFASGRDAQFLLAERLKDTNNDDDRREAQALLLNLIGQAEDDKDGKTAAKATAALARLLTSRGLLDDALGLYARLADKYPNVDVAGGKTGGDLLGELITDKQYWPALEPERPVTLGKYVAKAEAVNSGRQVAASIDLVPNGDLFPFYKRHRVSLENDQNGLLSLKVVDRVTGQDKFKPLNTENWPFQNYGYGMTHPNASMANQRLAQVNGHILLLHAGWWVRCYDLSRGVELWKYCIANVGGGPPPANSQFENWQMNLQGEANSDRDLKVNVYRYNNQTGQQTTEWTFVAGKSTVLQAGYAAFLSKDGLFTKDPRTGTTLWQRGGITQGAMIFGDATHLFLVEPTQAGFSSRVLRAVDGVQIPGVPEFGSLLLGNSRVHVFGRQVLLFESGGKDKPRTLRLYDILDGKDVWAKQYPADSAVFETVDPDLTGVVSGDGKIEVLAARTGKPLFAGAVDAKKVKEHLHDEKGKFDVVKPLLMADGERYYTFLNQDVAKNNNGSTAEGNNGPSPNRVRLVNGAAYAFSKATGERLWYTDTQLVNQRLYVDRFDELPCLVAFNPMYQEEGAAPGGPGGGGAVVIGGGRVIRGGFGGGGAGMPGWSHKVVVIDKQLGNLREDKNLPAGNGWFQWVSYDAKKNEYEFGGYNNAKLRIFAPPTDSAKK